MTAAHYDAIRVAAAKTEALAHALESMFDGLIWPPGVDRQDVERLAHLIGATHDAAVAALDACHAANADLANSTPPAADGAEVWR